MHFRHALQYIFSPLFTLSNPNAYGTSTNDLFGYASAISGNYAAITAVYEDDASGTESGKVYVFNVTTGALLYTLSNPNPYGASTSDQFGYVLATKGDYLLVGAPNEDSVNRTDSGVVYLYHLPTGNLVRTTQNPNPDSAVVEGDGFGFSVAMNATYMYIGTPREKDGEHYSGKVHAYSIGTGDLIATYTNPNPYGTAYMDLFGTAVAANAVFVAIGAPAEDDASGADSGKVHIYRAGASDLKFTIDNPNPFGTSAGDRFGTYLALSDDHKLVVSTVYADDASGTDSGKVYVYQLYENIMQEITATLLYTLDNPNPFGTSTNDWFGRSIAINSTYLVVGANNEDDAGGLDGGRAYVYNRTTGALVRTINGPNPDGISAGDRFGVSVAINDSNVLVVGAWGEDDAGTDSGKAYIYQL